MRSLRAQHRSWGCVDSRGKCEKDQELGHTLAENKLAALLAGPIEDDSKIGNKWLNGDTSLGTDSFKGYTKNNHANG